MRILLLVAAASLAFSQTGQVWQLSHHKQGAEQAAAALRGVAEVRQAAADAASGAVTVDGTPAQLAVAGWLFERLNAPAKQPGAHEYRPPAAGDDVVRVFYLDRAGSEQALREAVVTLRMVGAIRRAFPYSPLDAVAVRGSGREIALAAWIIDRLDGARSPGSLAYKLPDDEVIGYFEVSHAQTPRDIQEIVTLIRAVADIQRTNACQARRAVMARAPAERMALAAWLVAGLDRPAATAEDRAARHEYRLLTGPDNMVRVFYLPPGLSEKEYQETVTRVRRNAGTPRMFVYSALRAMAVRGTVGQLATAERALEELSALK